VRHLFDGIADYTRVLDAINGVVFVTGTMPGPEFDAEFAAWRTANATRLAAAQEAERRFSAEAFALDTLCGSVLAVAEKALELYSTRRQLPGGLPLPLKAAAARYCVGRLVRGLQIGLLVHAGRNQHVHHEELPREPGLGIFHWLATGTATPTSEQGWDPAFDPRRFVSLAGNVTALVGWRDYQAYLGDMREMLELSI
jgi:hypothetical protein